MTKTPIYNFDHLEPLAGSPEVPVNDQMDAAENAINKTVTWDFDGATTFTLTQDQVATGFIHVCINGHASGSTLYLPITDRFVVVQNDQTEDLTVRVVGDVGSTVVIANGIAVAVYADGTDVTEVTGFNPPATILSSNWQIPQRGALVELVADDTGANYSAGAVIPFDAEVYDTDTIHDNSTNNTRLTVPSGVTKVRLGCTVELGLIASIQFVILTLFKNGVDTYPGCVRRRAEISAVGSEMGFSSGILEVSATDYFEVHMDVETDTSVTVNSDRTHFWMEIVEVENASALPYHVGDHVEGTFASDEVCVKHMLTEDVNFAEHFAGNTNFEFGVAADAETIFDIVYDGSSVGSATVAISATVATFSVTGGITGIAGKVLEIIAPNSADANLADGVFGIAGYLA